MMRALFFLLPLLGTASASLINHYLLNALTQGLDPWMSNYVKSTLGPDLFDMDSGSSSSGNQGSSYYSGMGSWPLYDSMLSPYGRQMMNSINQGGWYGSLLPVPAQQPSLPTFTSTNIVTPSASNPSKAQDPQSSSYGTPGQSNDVVVTSPAAVVDFGPISAVSTNAQTTNPYSGGLSMNNLFRGYWMWSLMDMMDFF